MSGLMQWRQSVVLWRKGMTIRAHKHPSCITVYKHSAPTPAKAVHFIEGRWQCLQPAQHPQAHKAPTVLGLLRMQRQPQNLLQPCPPPGRLAQQLLCPPLQRRVQASQLHWATLDTAHGCLQGSETLRQPRAHPGPTRAPQAGWAPSRGWRTGARSPMQPALHRTAAGSAPPGPRAAAPCARRTPPPSAPRWPACT